MHILILVHLYIHVYVHKHTRTHTHTHTHTRARIAHTHTQQHLAAAEGQDKAVQYLIAKGADVNFKDRWDATALQDAVQSGHLQVAEQILSRGGVMTTTLGNILTHIHT